jgi:hypothetical protein
VIKKILPYLLLVLLSSCNTLLSLKEKVRSKLTHQSAPKKSTTKKSTSRVLENNPIIIEDSLAIIANDTLPPPTLADTIAALATDTTMLGSTQLVNNDSSLVISDTMVTQTGGPTKIQRGDTTVVSSDFDYSTKIRIITINKITKDTIIEWLTPEEANSVSSVINATKKKAEPIALPRTVVTQDELFRDHGAIYFSKKEGPRIYQLQGDTLFVQAPEKSLAELYQTIAKETSVVAEPEIIVKTKPGNKKVKDNKIQPREQSPRRAKVDSLREAQRLRNDSIAIVNIQLEKAMRQRAIDSARVVETASIPINDTLIGDAWLDNDPEARLISDNSLLQTMNARISNNWHSFKAKAKINYQSAKDEQNVSVNLRLVNDSCTWASVIVVLEAMRAMITTDSTKVMNRLKDNYVVYGNAQLQDLIQLPIEANDLQDLLIGSIPLSGLQQMRAKTNNTLIGIFAATPNGGPKATLIYNADSTLRSVYIRGNNKQGYYTLRCIYNEYVQTDMGRISTSRSITSFINGVTTTITMELNKIEFNADCDLPFDIPAKFKRVENIKLKERK